MKEITVDAKIENVDKVLDFVDAELEKANCNPKTIIEINIAIDEIFSNIANYAYKDNNGTATIEMELNDKTKDVVITFIDSGIPYNPLLKEDPDVKAKLEDRNIGGLGVFMVKKIMDDVVYEYREGKNVFKIRKNIV